MLGEAEPPQPIQAADKLPFGQHLALDECFPGDSVNRPNSERPYLRPVKRQQERQACNVSQLRERSVRGMLQIRRRHHVDFVVNEADRLPEVVLDHQKVEIDSRAIEAPLPMPQAELQVAPATALLTHAVAIETHFLAPRSGTSPSQKCQRHARCRQIVGPLLAPRRRWSRRPKMDRRWCRRVW